MSEKNLENNTVTVIGQVVSDFTFSHEVFGFSGRKLKAAVSGEGDSA